MKLQDPLLDPIARRAVQKDYSVKIPRAEPTQDTNEQHSSRSEDYLTANRLHQYDDIRRKLTKPLSSDALKKLKVKELMEQLDEDLMRYSLTSYTFSKEVIQEQTPKKFTKLKNDISKRKTKFTSGMSDENRRSISIVSRFLDLEKKEKLIAVNIRHLWSRVSDPTKWWNIVRDTLKKIHWFKSRIQFKLHEQLRVGLRHRHYLKNEPEESIKNRKSFMSARVRLSEKNPQVRKCKKKS